jgi:hypothetical protein
MTLFSSPKIQIICEYNQIYELQKTTTLKVNNIDKQQIVISTAEEVT